MLYGWAAGLGWAGLAGLGLGEANAKTTKIWHREKCLKFLRDFNYCGVFDAYAGGLLGSEMQFSIVLLAFAHVTKIKCGASFGMREKHQNA